jgi:predicted phosphodiesterase
MKACVLLLIATSAIVWSHDEPIPLMHWDFNQKFVKQNVLVSQKGPDLIAPIQRRHTLVANVPSLVNEGKQAFVAADEVNSSQLPAKDLTVSVWASVDQPLQYGGLVCFLQDNGNKESGWVLGYNETNFTFALASQNTKQLTYLSGKTKFEIGKIYHVVGTYDGEIMNLYVNGRLDATSRAQSAAIHYPPKAKLCVGGYLDDNENFPLSGTLREAFVYDMVATAKGVAHSFEAGKALAAAPAKVNVRVPFEFDARPFLQMASTDSMGVNWATTQQATGSLFWGETSECIQKVPLANETKFHQYRIEGLQPDTQYFYRTETVNKDGVKLTSPVSTFETAPQHDSPIAFAIISDTQGNPEVSNKMAKFAWSQRPDFLVIPGDLTDTGTVHDHWTKQFFPSMDVLIKRVPMYPVLGNHERNAHWYYDYMNLPAPEYYYTFHYGPAQFFMIDSNKKCGPGSEQFLWLESELKKSTADWKMVVHHHPVYSSDENDYGDLWKTNRSSRGDTNVQAMSKLYDQYGVDVVFNGHIHSYERTWQVRDGKVVQNGGTQYFVTGGGGGPLETAGPSRPKFQNTVKHGHHYSMVRINGNLFEFQAYDIDGRLFDSLRYERER